MLKRVLLPLFLLGFVTSCNKEVTTGVPDATVSFTCNISSTGYANLLTPLGSVSVQGGYAGNGILLYCLSATDYLAFDQSCPYDCQTNSKAVVGVQPGNIIARCPVCGTTYSLTYGIPTGGPGKIGLKQYYTQFTSPNLSVSSSPF